MRKKILMFALLALALTACRLESNVSLNIAKDGSAVITTEIGMDDAFRDLVTGNSGMTEDEFVDNMFSELDGGTGPIDVRKDGDMTYYTMSTNVKDLSAWDGGGPDAGFTQFSFNVDDDGAKLTATIEAEDSEEFGEGFGIDAADMDFIKATVTVQMPGTVTEHNADEVTGNKLTWNAPLDGKVEILAVSTFGGSSSSWIWIVVGVVLLLAVIAAIIAVMASRKRAHKPSAGAPAVEDEPTPSSSTSTNPDAVVEEPEPVSTDTPDDAPDGSI